jgi:hypothetical protein
VLHCLEENYTTYYQLWLFQHMPDYTLWHNIAAYCVLLTILQGSTGFTVSDFWRTWHVSLSGCLECTVQFYSVVRWGLTSGTVPLSSSSHECIQNSSVIKIWSKHIVKSILHRYFISFSQEKTFNLLRVIMM